MESDTHKPLIVLIEDEELLSNILSDKLRRMGYRVETAMDGEAGYALIESLNPDLVLLDMLLPKLNGFGVLERLYETGKMPKLPVIAISNSGQPIEIERAQKLGIRDYLVKLNFDPDEVLEKVREIFEKTSSYESASLKKEVLTTATPPKDSTAPTSAPVPSPTGRPHVLIVEDDLFIADLLGRKLHTKYEVHRAGETTTALKMLAEHPVSLICLDIMLPGEDGYAFLKRLKSNPTYKDIPVIILSNLGQEEEIGKGLSLGAVDYLIKANMSPDDILGRVTEVLTTH